ncbi:hypothetical protein ACJX0J_012284 [Zea mays]
MTHPQIKGPWNLSDETHSGNLSSGVIWTKPGYNMRLIYLYLYIYILLFNSTNIFSIFISFIVHITSLIFLNYIILDGKYNHQPKKLEFKLGFTHFFTSPLHVFLSLFFLYHTDLVCCLCIKYTCAERGLVPVYIHLVPVWIYCVSIKVRIASERIVVTATGVANAPAVQYCTPTGRKQQSVKDAKKLIGLIKIFGFLLIAHIGLVLLTRELVNIKQKKKLVKNIMVLSGIYIVVASLI